MSDTKHILILVGGGGSEHEISLQSAEFMIESLRPCSQFKLIPIEINNQGHWIYQNKYRCSFNTDRLLEIFDSEKTIERLFIDAVIPCIHGWPGETGDLQSFFDLIKLPYFGNRPEASKLCFNKIMTKLWLDKIGIPTVPYIFLADMQVNQDLQDFFQKHKQLFVKASNQGSSVGCYPADSLKELENVVRLAFQFSPFVLIEKRMQKFRELEVSAYQFQGKLHISAPGEIITPSDDFYTYDQKYASTSQTRTQVPAKDLNSGIIKEIQSYARLSFEALNLRHLARIDFFLSEDQQVYLNEVNTFPGMTSISLFPKMLEANGHHFSEYLKDNLTTIVSRPHVVA